MTNNLSDFQTILWPATKVSNVGFYKKPSAGFTSGQVIEAPFTRAGAGRKVIDASGNLVDAAANVPAWTFPIGGSSAGCPYLSFLPSVENKQTRSEEFDDAVWVKTNATITANATTSPDGTVNAELFNDDNSGGTGTVRLADSIAGLTTSATHTLSVFAKANTLNQIVINANNYDGTTDGSAFFNLETGAVSGETNVDASGMVDMGNGWYYCYIQYTQGAATTSVGTQFFVAENDSTTVDLDGTSSIFIWGAQLKEGSYISPLDYVKTEASAVTRSADAITNNTDLSGSGYYPDSSNASLIYQIKWEGEANGGATNRFELRNSAGTRLITLVPSSGGFSLVSYLDGSSTVYAFENGALERLVVTWNGTTASFYANGFLVRTITASSSFDINQIVNANSPYFEIDFKMLNFAPTALTANQAEAASSWPSFDLMVSDLGYS